MKTGKVEKICRFCQHLSTLYRGPDNTLCKNEAKEFVFIPSYKEYIYRVLDLFNHLNITKESKIIDLGCGISPLLLYLASEKYKNLYGIDNESNLVCLLNRFSSDISDEPTEINTRNGDLLKLDQKSSEWIKEVDFIYLYMPIKDKTLYKSMIKSVFDLMKPGAVIIDYYGPIGETLKANKKSQSTDGVFAIQYYQK